MPQYKIMLIYSKILTDMQLCQLQMVLEKQTVSFFYVTVLMRQQICVSSIHSLTIHFQEINYSLNCKFLLADWIWGWTWSVSNLSSSCDIISFLHVMLYWGVFSVISFPNHIVISFMILLSWSQKKFSPYILSPFIFGEVQNICMGGI